MELIEGCADPSACNYHPNATYNNGCFYAQNNFDSKIIQENEENLQLLLKNSL